MPRARRNSAEQNDAEDSASSWTTIQHTFSYGGSNEKLLPGGNAGGGSSDSAQGAGSC